MVEIEYDQEISKVERNQELAIILKDYDSKSNQLTFDMVSGQLTAWKDLGLQIEYSAPLL